MHAVNHKKAKMKIHRSQKSLFRLNSAPYVEITQTYTYIGGSLMLMYFDWELVFLPLRQCPPAKQDPAVQACDYIPSPHCLPQIPPAADLLLPSSANVNGSVCTQTVVSRFAF